MSYLAARGQKLHQTEDMMFIKGNQLGTKARIQGVEARPLQGDSGFGAFFSLFSDGLRSRSQQKRISSRTKRQADGVSGAYALGGRLLILAASLLIAVMPVTDYFWHFDKFLRGGQDFELGLLSLITIFSMVLVLLRQRRQDVAQLFTIQRWLSFGSMDSDLPIRGGACSLVVDLHDPLTLHPALCSFSLPIQV
jgi:hypothetical protein